MAKTDTEHDNLGESSVGRTLLILLGIVVVVFGIYYLANSGKDNDKAANEKPGDSKQVADETAKQNKKAENTNDKQKAIQQAQDAARRGVVSESVASDSKDSLSFVAGSGESYTGLARRAIAASGDNLSSAERVAAETKLTQDAGVQSLVAGQEITLSKSAVDAAIKWAQNLSADQKAAWQPYADMVAW